MWCDVPLCECLGPHVFHVRLDFEDVRGAAARANHTEQERPQVAISPALEMASPHCTLGDVGASIGSPMCALSLA